MTDSYLEMEQDRSFSEPFSDPNTVVLAVDEMALTQKTVSQEVWIPLETTPAVTEINGLRLDRSICGFFPSRQGKDTQFQKRLRNYMTLRPDCVKFAMYTPRRRLWFHRMSRGGTA